MKKPDPNCKLCGGYGIIVKDDFQKDAPACPCTFEHELEQAKKDFKRPNKPDEKDEQDDKEMDIEYWSNHTIKECVDETFAGLHDAIGDKDLSDWYIDLIQNTLESYAKFQLSRISKND